jgi:hypothetical protein
LESKDVDEREKLTVFLAATMVVMREVSADKMKARHSKKP